MHVTAFDNLMRRGSELNLPVLRKHGVRFIHGDVRCKDDLQGVEDFDLLIDCSAEPSVHAGASGSPAKVIDINLNGTINCLELARANTADVLFISTSRVYPVQQLRGLNTTETENRFELAREQPCAGVSVNGINEDFPLTGARSFYGATKLASELFLQEYVHSCGMRGLINRCGVLAGPRQMGRTDQGVVTLWVARHIYNEPLSYIGFGGTGKQVRDILHIRDLFDLICKQTASLQNWDGRVFNVGGGRAMSASLKELTSICQAVTGHTIPVTSMPDTAAVDIPIYLSDTTRAERHFQWTPARGVEETVRDIANWIHAGKAPLRAILSGQSGAA